MSDRLEDYFGLCPICKKTDGFINVGRSHWFYCREHKKKWCAGANLFSGWRDQTEDQQRKIYDDLEFGSYENIEPLRSHTPADSVDEHLNWVTERMEDAIADYIVLSQAWDHRVASRRSEQFRKRQTRN